MHSADFGAAAGFGLILVFGLAEFVGDAQSYVAVVGIEEIPVAARQDGALVTLRAVEKVVGRDAARQSTVQKIPAQGSVEIPVGAGVIGSPTAGAGPIEPDIPHQLAGQDERIGRVEHPIGRVVVAADSVGTDIFILRAGQADIDGSGPPPANILVVTCTDDERPRLGLVDITHVVHIRILFVPHDGEIGRVDVEVVAEADVEILP